MSTQWCPIVTETQGLARGLPRFARPVTSVRWRVNLGNTGYIVVTWGNARAQCISWVQALRTARAVEWAQALGCGRTDYAWLLSGVPLVMHHLPPGWVDTHRPACAYSAASLE